MFSSGEVVKAKKICRKYFQCAWSVIRRRRKVLTSSAHILTAILGMFNPPSASGNES